MTLPLQPRLQTAAHATTAASFAGACFGKNQSKEKNHEMQMQLTNKKDTKMKMKCTLAALSVAVLTVAGTGFSAYAQDVDGWQFSAALPLWAPSADGNITLGGQQRDFSVGFDEIKDHVESSFSLNLEARTENYGFYGGLGYMKFTGDAGPVYATLKLFIGEAGGFYRFLNTGGDHPFILEGLVGMRDWNTDSTFTSPNPLLNGGKSRNVADPIIGLRGSQILTPKLHLDFKADVGGFDISESTDITWSAGSMFTYDFKKWFSLSAGYQALAIDEETSSGPSQRGLDLILHGPVLLLKFTF